ncbi:MAG TPA: ABC transporter ATP-binding protein [Candidatus Methylomirabilis sp.]|nr:ABC transporter ATP-binding protein [Candidatus Methylomirabilis sp.]
MYIELIRLIRKLSPWNFGAVCVLSLMTSTFETASLALFAPLLALLTGVPAGGAGWPARLANTMFGTVNRESAIVFFALVFAGLMVGRFISTALNNWAIARAEARVLRYLRMRCLDVLFYVPQSFLDNYDNARIMQHFNEQAMRSAEGLRVALRSISSVATFLFNIILLLFLSVSLTLVSLALLTVMGLVLTPIPRRIKFNAQRYVEAMFDYNRKMVDLVSGIRTVRSFATYDKERLKTAVLLDKQVEAHVRKTFFSGITVPLFEVFAFLVLCLIMILSVFMVTREAWLAVMAPFLVVLARSIPQAAVVNNLRSLSSLTSADYHSLQQFIQTLEEQTHQKKPMSGAVMEIKFDHVAATYGVTRILHDVDFSIKRGEHVLLVGASGSGKTTILNLLVGLYSPSAGRILVNGINLSEIDIHEWRSHIGVVEQTPFIFNDSVRNNIAYRDNRITELAMWEALKTVGLAEFVASKPQGLDTQLGDNAVTLSGGQRQRLAFARALAHRPDILILDEPTSALDEETESFVLKEMRKQYVDSTIIAVSHSPSLYDLFDSVYKIDQKSITRMRAIA